MKRLHIKNNHNHTFRRVLAVLLAAAMTFALAGCSPRELHIGQVEVNTGVNTAWITPARGVDKFDIPASDFSAGADGSVTYTGTAYRVLQGIDVSTFQQDIDWQAVADSGIAFAVIRAGYRGYGKGSIVEDDRFRQNVAGARADRAAALGGGRQPGDHGHAAVHGRGARCVVLCRGALGVPDGARVRHVGRDV